MENKVIMIPFPRDVCSRDIISYFLQHPYTVYPGPFMNTHKNDCMDWCKG